MIGSVETELSIRAVGVSVNIAEDNIAKLMYYLNSMHTCLGGDVIPDQFTDHRKYYSLSNDEKTAVVALSVLLSPDLLMGKVIFPVENGNPILNGSNNEFYDLTEAKRLLAGAATAEGIIIMEGKTVNVTKIMVFTANWLTKFFLNPLKGEAWRVRQLTGGGGSNNSSPARTYSSGSGEGVPSGGGGSRRNCGPHWAYLMAFIGFAALMFIIVGYGTSAWLRADCTVSGWNSGFLWQSCCHDCVMSATSGNVCETLFGGNNKCISFDPTVDNPTYLLITKIAGGVTSALVLLGFYCQIRYSFYRDVSKARCYLFQLLTIVVGVVALISFGIQKDVQDFRTAGGHYGYSLDLFCIGLVIELIPVLYLCCA